MIIDIVWIIVGLTLLFVGGEGLMRGSVSLARSFLVSKLLVSTVIIGFGTSMPEMTVSVGAALKGSPDIALGNVIGSNTANILLIIGIAALISPVIIKASTVQRDVIMMNVAAFVLAGLMLMGQLSLFAGCIMIVGLLGYVLFSYRKDKMIHQDMQHQAEEDMGSQKPYHPALAGVMCLAGLGLLIVGAGFLVDSAVSIARNFGISEAVIGLTLVAVGTSLPELATAVVSSIRKHSDMVIGNILGSNIFNILAILGVTSVITPIPISAQMLQVDIWVMIATTLFLSALLLMGKGVTRSVGVVMMAAYAYYTYLLYTSM